MCPEKAAVNIYSMTHIHTTVPCNMTPSDEANGISDTLKNTQSVIIINHNQLYISI